MHISTILQAGKLIEQALGAKNQPVPGGVFVFEPSWVKIVVAVGLAVSVFTCYLWFARPFLMKRKSGNWIKRRNGKCRGDISLQNSVKNEENGTD